MFNRVSMWFAVAILLAAGLSASPASAQFIFGGPGGYGIGAFDYNRASGFERIPYYSLYPPVYYSYPVARPYGTSPFAYPPGTMTPEVSQQVAPVEYRNPFVPQGAGSTSDKTASMPRVYHNPFVKQPQTASTLATVSRGDP